MKKIMLRINGIIKTRVIDSYRLYKNEKNSFTKGLFIYCCLEFFFGKLRKNMFCYDKAFSCYVEKDILNFKIARIPYITNNKKYLKTVFDAFRNLLGPYLYKDFKLSIEGTYENYGIEIEKDDVVIDAGSNIGVFSSFSAIKGAKRVYSFEPVKENYDILVRTADINNKIRKTIKPIKKGLSNKVESKTIRVDGTCSSFVINKDVCDYENIELTTIDKFVEDNDIEKIDFIKADIEGAERYMLEGSIRTLKKYKPKLAVCIYHLPDDKEVLTEIILRANPDYKINYSSHKLHAK